MAQPSKIPLKFNGADIQFGDIKTAMVEAGAKGASTLAFRVPLDAVLPLEGFNLRVESSPEYQAQVEYLTQQMLQHGFDESKPLTVGAIMDGKHTRLYVTSGHTRRAAALAANAIIAAGNGPDGAKPIEWVPVIPKRYESVRAMTRELYQANSGLNPSVLEQSIYVARQLAEGATVDEIAADMGKTPRYISDIQVLLKAPAGVKRMVVGGQVAATEAIKEVRKAIKAGNVKLAEEKLSGALEKTGGKKVTRKALTERKPEATAPQRETTPPSGDEAQATPAPQAKPISSLQFIQCAVMYSLRVAQSQDWLARWYIEGEPETMAELEAFIGQPEGATADASKRVPLVMPPILDVNVDPETLEPVAGAAEEPNGETVEEPGYDVQRQAESPPTEEDNAEPEDIGPEPTVLDSKGKVLGKLMMPARLRKIEEWVKKGGVRTVDDFGNAIDPILGASVNGLGLLVANKAEEEAVETVEPQGEPDPAADI